MFSITGEQLLIYVLHDQSTYTYLWLQFTVFSVQWRLLFIFLVCQLNSGLALSLGHFAVVSLLSGRTLDIRSKGPQDQLLARDIKIFALFIFSYSLDLF
jgi:hypothetical protein